MNKFGWLMAALVVSWTLNVALGVALFLKSQYPEGAFFHEPPQNLPGAMHPPDEMLHRKTGMAMNTEMRKQTIPLRQNEARLMMDLAEELSFPLLDTFKVKAIADTLEQVKCQLHKLHINHLINLHGKIPDHTRRELAPRIMHRMGRGINPPRWNVSDNNGHNQ